MYIYIYHISINICYLSERYSNWFFSIFHGNMILEIASINKRTCHTILAVGSPIQNPGARLKLVKCWRAQVSSSKSWSRPRPTEAKFWKLLLLCKFQVSSFLLFMFIERSKWYCSNWSLCLTLPARHWHWRLAFCLRFLTGEVQRQQLMEIHTIEFVYSHRMNMK